MNDGSKSSQMMARAWRNQVLLEVFEAFAQNFSKYENARMREEGISVVWRLSLGLFCAEMMLIYVCFNNVKPMLNLLSSK